VFALIAIPILAEHATGILISRKPGLFGMEDKSVPGGKAMGLRTCVILLALLMFGFHFKKVTAQQSMAAQQSQAQQQAQAIAQAPAPDVLYNNALRDYNGGKNDLASQEFNDYIKFYPNTDLAGNAYFYLAEIQFKAGDYQKAVANYDLVLQNFPSGNKAAAAHLKKGYALLELGKEEEGTQELKHVIQRYPRTNEAVQARERLRKLTPAPRSH